jgi:uncharacterized membrane protein
MDCSFLDHKSDTEINTSLYSSHLSFHFLHYPLLLKFKAFNFSVLFLLVLIINGITLQVLTLTRFPPRASVTTDMKYTSLLQHYTQQTN